MYPQYVGGGHYISYIQKQLCIINYLHQIKKIKFIKFFLKVWFQNRRARSRKQERTGCISLRSKYRQKRLETLQQRQAVASAMSASLYPGYYHGYGSNYPGGMVTPPQPAPLAPYFSAYAIPSDITSNSVGGISFPTGYVAMGMQNPGYAYSSPRSDSLVVPVSK